MLRFIDQATAKSLSPRLPAGVQGMLRADGVVQTHRGLHLALLVFLMAGHTVVHYAALLPGLKDLVEGMPFFDIHILHEAEYLGMIANASLVFRMRGGLTAIAAAGVASIPFATVSHGGGASSYSYDYDYGAAATSLPGAGMSGGEQQLLGLTVLLVIALWLVFANEMWARQRDRHVRAIQQLTAVNTAVQTQLNQLFGEIRESVEEEEAALRSAPPERDLRRTAFVQRMRRVLDGGR